MSILRLSFFNQIGLENSTFETIIMLLRNYVLHFMFDYFSLTGTTLWIQFHIHSKFCDGVEEL